MEEELQAAGICGGNWWINSSKSVFMGGTSPCSMGIHSDLGAYGSYWTDIMVDLKPRSSCKDFFYNSNVLHNNNNNKISSASGDHSFMAFQSSQEPQQQADSDSGDSSILMDSTLQMMGFNFSSSCPSSPDWNQALILSGNTGGENYNPTLQEEMNLDLNPSSEVQKDWTEPKTFTVTVTGCEEDPTISLFKAVNQDFYLDQQILNPLNTSYNDPTATCQDISSSVFLRGSSTYDYPLTLVQSLFEADPPQPQQQSIFNNRSLNYCGTNNWSTEPSPSCWPYKISSSVSNNTPFWNASATSSSQPHFVVPTLEEKPTENKLVRKTGHEASGSVVKKSCEPILKRPRIETPSPLPTFKVRKEKMGDRITALQQLVSPFGKTDTASVLHEAIEYIKFLHDQVNVLGTPFLKNGNATQRQQVAERLKDSEGPREDLRSRGLCLVPISSTFSVANESLGAFQTPTFGCTFR